MRTRLVAATVLVMAMLVVPGILYAQVPAVQPGDSIGGMALRSDGSEGPPIWAFCVPAFLNPGVTTAECSVPAFPELAIGHGWFSADETLRDLNWQAMTWELYLDGQQVDLNAFGTFDADLPQTGLPGHDANDEVVTKLRSWDVVVGNPTAGPHTLRSVLHLNQQVNDGFHVTEAGTYELVVNFAVEATPPADALPETGDVAFPSYAWILAMGGIAILSGLCLRRVARHGR